MAENKDRGNRPDGEDIPGGASIIPIQRAERLILLIRGQKVILDSDLAELCGVPTKRLNEQVRRNQGRFPSDFMFQLTLEEAERLRSQIATSNVQVGRGGRRSSDLSYCPRLSLLL
ncbi:MAG: ORF6N domain-containing protein [Solirubrobacterales bacterium]